jgi:uncharacterized protein
MRCPQCGAGSGVQLEAAQTPRVRAMHDRSVMPNDSATPGAQPATFKVLSLAGGGFLGLYTACVLEALEARAGRPLGRCFDLIAGTSVGGILALALAYEVPVSRLTRLFDEHGTEVFSARSLPTGPMSRLIDLTRSVLGPKYSGDALREVLLAELGERTLSQALHPVVIPAVEVDRCRTKIFKTPHVAASSGDGALHAVDVAMATSAAPSYFPAQRIGDRLYADGGLFAVAPDQVAVHEVEHFMGIDLSRVSMLSIGTGVAQYRPAEGVRDDAGAVGWLSDGRLVLTLISVQQHVQAMVEDRLGRRYVRLDADWPPEGGMGIDVATPQARRQLRAMARRTLREADVRWLASTFMA